MIIFYHGLDGYRLSQAVKNLAEQYKEKYKHGLSASFIDAAESGALEALENSLKLNSLFNEVSLIILNNPFISTPISERIAKMLNDQDAQDRKDSVVVLVGEGDIAKTKHKSLMKLVANKKTKTQEFKPLSGSSLVGWITDEFKTRRCLADQAAAQEIIELVGDNSWDIIQEIDKLSNYSSSVGIEQVRALVSDRRNIGPFELIDAVVTRNYFKALSLLETELMRGRDPYNILGALTSHFRALLAVWDASEQGISQYDIASQSGLHPFVVRKAAASNRLFKPSEAKEMFAQLADLDRLVKDGQRILADELFVFLIRMGNIAN
ncbi:MAG: DNA polymerase III subunit delta [Patescibacteria group bacterium]